MNCPYCRKEMILEELDFGRGDESDIKKAWYCEKCNEIEPYENDFDYLEKIKESE